MMGGKNPAADKALQRLVDRRLQQSGGSQLGIKAVVVNGAVTITGKLKFDNQRLPLMKSMRGVPGVKNLVDQVQGPPKHVAKRPEQNASHESSEQIVESSELEISEPIVESWD
jgi:osmotically-inducible protein OsmY